MARFRSVPMEMKEPSGSWSRNCFGIAKRPFESTFIREEPANIHFLSLDRGDGDEWQLGRRSGCLTATLAATAAVAVLDRHSYPLITSVRRACTDRPTRSQ